MNSIRLWIAMVVGICLMVGAFAGISQAATIQIMPTADCYTDSSAPASPNVNSNLRVGYDTNRGMHRSYLKFDLTNLTGKQVTSATLSMDALFPLGTPIGAYYMSTDSWTENSVTWNSQSQLTTNPSPTSVVAVQHGGRVEWDVTPIINEPDKTLSIMMKSQQESTPNLYTQFFSTRMTDDSYKPYLEVTYQDGSQGNCTTSADTDCNGCVSLSEIIQAIVKFKQGNSQLSLSQLIQIIVQFKTGGISC